MEVMTLVIEDRSGNPVDMARVRQLLGPEFKVRTWKPGSVIEARIAVDQGLETLRRAISLMGGEVPRKRKPRAEVFELSCGGCGGADMRLRGRGTYASDHWSELDAVCRGCGSVTHLATTIPTIEKSWGREDDGEKAEGVLCAMPWKEGVDRG